MASDPLHMFSQAARVLYSSKKDTILETTDQFMHSLSSNLQMARNALKLAQERMRTCYNLKRRGADWDVGDRVWLSATRACDHIHESNFQVWVP